MSFLPSEKAHAFPPYEPIENVRRPGEDVASRHSPPERLHAAPPLQPGMSIARATASVNPRSSYGLMTAPPTAHGRRPRARSGSARPRGRRAPRRTPSRRGSSRRGATTRRRTAPDGTAPRARQLERLLDISDGTVAGAVAVPGIDARDLLVDFSREVGVAGHIGPRRTPTCTKTNRCATSGRSASTRSIAAMRSGMPFV